MSGLPFGRPRVALLELNGAISGTQKIHNYARLLERMLGPMTRAVLGSVEDAILEGESLHLDYR
ncbi:MAG: hypothetical protein EXR55_06685 [Dehalococcoidia bacterium]|nr:hypothetical protein [Dehalococcoidia bacterium]